MLTPLRTFTTDAYRTFAVRLLPAGARLGTGPVSNDSPDPVVEFWDTTYARDTNDGTYGVLGQFVSRYRLSTLLAVRGGLCLEGSASVAWSLDNATLTAVQDWLSILSTVPTP